MDRKWYVLMELVGDGPQINGCDSWLCPWSDWAGFLECMFESMEDPRQIVNIRFTQLEMTDDELRAYIKQNDIEWDL